MKKTPDSVFGYLLELDDAPCPSPRFVPGPGMDGAPEKLRLRDRLFPVLAALALFADLNRRQGK